MTLSLTLTLLLFRALLAAALANRGAGLVFDVTWKYEMLTFQPFNDYDGDIHCIGCHAQALPGIHRQSQLHWLLWCLTTDLLNLRLCWAPVILLTA